MLKNLAITTILFATASCAFEQKPAPYVQRGDEVYTKSASNTYMPSSGRQNNQVDTSFGGAKVQSYDLAPANSVNTYNRNDGVIDFANQQQNTSISRPIVSDYIDSPNGNPVASNGEYSFGANNNQYAPNNSGSGARARPVLDDEPTSSIISSNAPIDFGGQKPASGNLGGNFGGNTSRNAGDSNYLDLSNVNQFNSTQNNAPAPSRLGSVSPASKPQYVSNVEVESHITEIAGQEPITTIKTVEIIQPAPSDNSDFISVPPLQEVASVAPTKAFDEPVVSAPTAASQENEIEDSAIIRSGTAITTDKMFTRPVAGEIIGKFGNEEDGTFNDGIKIKAEKGTGVKAADGGEVVYSGNQLQGYGNMIIIRHASGYLTSYAHLEGLSMKKGTKVAKGDIIGNVGDTGNVSEPQLHFGVREGREPVDPQKFL